MGDRDQVVREKPVAIPFARLVSEKGARGGVLLSAALHVAVVLLLIWSGTRLVLAGRSPGSDQGPGGGGGGGRALLMYVTATQPAVPAPPTQVTVPVLAAVVIPVTQIRLPEVSLQQLGGVGSGFGSGQGSGMGPGAGTGSGGGTGSGHGTGVGPDSGGGSSFYPPSPQTVLIPPQHVPRALRGRVITATFDITVRGEVTRVSLDPMPTDSLFAAEFVGKLRQYTFTPARNVDGRPVAARLSVAFTLR